MNCPLSTEQIMMAYHCSKEAAILVRAFFQFGFIPAGASSSAEAEARRVIDEM